LARPTVELAAVLLPVLAFRRFYFGAWAPNSVTAKSGYFNEILALPFADAYRRISMDQGVKMLNQFGTERLGYLLLLIPLGWLSSQYRRQTSIFVIVGAILTAVAIWNNGDWMPHSRLLAPLIPLVGVAMATSIAQVGVWVKPRQVATSMQLILGLAIFAYGIDHAFYERTFAHTPNPVAEYMIELGKGLRSAHVSSEVLATDMAGRVPYFSGVRTIDMFGLCDTYIAHHGKPVLHMGKTDDPYVYRMRPDYYFYNFAFSVRGMINSQDFRPYANDYWVVMTPFAAKPANRVGKILLARKNLPRLAELVTRLNAKLVDPKTL
jgi:arabinofuranosyltransferase